MYQIIHCSCGESSMLDGRCIGCGCVRPSSDEVREYIRNNKKEYDKLVKELALATKLEDEDETI